MEFPRDMWQELCSYYNLELAYCKARKHKTTKPYVLEFEKSLSQNLLQLQQELRSQTYVPQPLQTFILHDPKTRKISKSDFRDRVVHHALCNVLEPLFEPLFIYDSYANRKGKGTLKAIQRFERFHHTLSQNHTRQVFVFKADVRHYFEEVDHSILMRILQQKVKDPRVMWLIQRILDNFEGKEQHKGMPLGNLTSQFFANVYLNELDQFIKHQLRIKYYLRYVDDFVILNSSKNRLEEHQTKISVFLHEKLALQLHPDKSRMFILSQGVDFLGLQLFPHHKIIKRRNIQYFKRKLRVLCEKYAEKEMEYDIIYDLLEGWIAYSRNANTYTLRQKVLKNIEALFAHEISTKEYNRYRHEMARNPIA